MDPRPGAGCDPAGVSAISPGPWGAVSVTDCRTWSAVDKAASNTRHSDVLQPEDHHCCGSRPRAASPCGPCDGGWSLPAPAPGLSPLHSVCRCAMGEGTASRHCSSAVSPDRLTEVVTCRAAPCPLPQNAAKAPSMARASAGHSARSQGPCAPGGRRGTAPLLLAARALTSAWPLCHLSLPCGDHLHHPALAAWPALAQHVLQIWDTDLLAASR